MFGKILHRPFPQALLPFRLCLLAFMCFSMPPVHAQLVGLDAYMVGNNAEIGIDGYGGFEGCEMSVSPPLPGMHTRTNSSYFGFVANTNNGNWANFDGDFFTP
jgi:hypothetical protein